MPTRRDVLKIGVSTPFIPLLQLTEPKEEKVEGTLCYRIETVYKCLLTRGSESNFGSGNEYISASTGIEYSLTYKVNEWTYPKIGKIFCFKNLNDAIRYNGSICYEKPIFKAIATNVYKPNKIAKFHCACIKEFWDSNGEKDFYLTKDTCCGIKNTYLCDKLMLKERVE